MAAVTPTMIREHFETDLSDDALQRVIDAVASEVAAIFPVPTSNPVTEIYICNSMYDTGSLAPRRIFTKDKIADVVSISETPHYEYEGDEAVTVDPTDYMIDNSSYSIFRKRGYWCGLVTVQYHPLIDPNVDAQIALVVIDIVKMELQFNGLQSESAGDYSYTIMGASRDSILSRIKTFRRGTLFV